MQDLMSSLPSGHQTHENIRKINISTMPQISYIRSCTVQGRSDVRILNRWYPSAPLGNAPQSALQRICVAGFTGGTFPKAAMNLVLVKGLAVMAHIRKRYIVHVCLVQGLCPDPSV